MKLMSLLAEACHPHGRTSRRTYAIAGITLAALKFGLDRLVVLALGVDYWNWLNYWQPLAARFNGEAAALPEWLVPLLVLAMPFMFVGAMLTLRRLRDAGAPLWLVVLFFLPALNLVLFTLLCLLPSRDRPPPAEPRQRGPLAWFVRVFALERPAISAAMAMVLTTLLVAPMTWLATVFFRDYGWSVFIAMPFVLGLVASVIHGAAEPRTYAACARVSLLALFFCTVVILAVALEGIVCLLMAAPLATPVVLLGAAAGYYLQLARWGRTEQATRIYSAAWIALPLALASENRIRPEPAVIPATTCVDVAASPAAVWRQVVTFSELPPPNELIFRSGIAYPVRATITGHGVGAVRRCEFSTGPFVEPITVWEEGRHLAFDVLEQPHPMHELSPYRALHPAHLDGFFRSHRGEFRLTELPGGRTRLEGTTWYSQRFWPAAYWQAWSDFLLHSIHRRVLEHIRVQAELNPVAERSQ